MIEGFKNLLLSKLVDYDGNPISNSNPMPTIGTAGSSALPAALTRQNVFAVHGVSVGASSGNNSKFELWNPANSGKIIVVYNTWAWHTSGTVTYKASLSSSALSANESAVVKQNVVAGSSITSIAKIYTKNDDATSASTVISQLAITSTTPNGSGILALIQGIAMPENGVRFESTTANMAINGSIIWAEIDLSDLPTI